MGCAASTVSKSAVSEINPGVRDNYFVVLPQGDSGKRVCEASIDFEEPTRSFDSMQYRHSSQDPAKLPPVASTHQRHTIRMKQFLKAVPSQEAALRRDVYTRRLDVLKHRWAVET
ncbi:unnamed protein product [Effrenium voratum]|nr:unnamed protein product [Effrenium voratum]|mmetsp:Transcript_101975/g.243111  ORF Transcript_101975/g.243111 Transcript_101975/m.243111 type:complete len:115 (-) Transcript_101975:21-365(-)|eukprot:CAMPEP_0181482580 /NCGR_PEP_ID=MMETSP1110-20121109/44937_1 /TAXON_ID=174948 /ORGANISM="Symbiodinium sp., Strain CCMP421" /LENGTH=114 /DNA_ID=CAMNT_0023608181 /DNA_START=21 /DNA_END=365 /DNA_ORIENTATION=+